MTRAVALLLIAMIATLSYAEEGVPTAADPALEERVKELSKELRCLVCQNETIADSRAELAVDLRNQIREKLRAGMSEAAIKQYMVERYGDFILYRPPVKPTTALLWIGPFVLLIAGIAALLLILKRRRAKQDIAGALSTQDERRARELLGVAPDADKT
jgi:cytochrome c-type biogenesis protein CcmH